MEPFILVRESASWDVARKGSRLAEFASLGAFERRADNQPPFMHPRPPLLIALQTSAAIRSQQQNYAEFPLPVPHGMVSTVPRSIQKVCK
jgi:hypothetical protein